MRCHSMNRFPIPRKEQRIAYVDVHAPNGAHLFTYDPARSLVQIKVKGLGLLTVALEQYW